MVPTCGIKVPTPNLFIPWNKGGPAGKTRKNQSSLREGLCSGEDADVTHGNEDRGVLKLTGEEFSLARARVLAEVCLSVVLCFWAALSVPGTFLPILPDSNENRVVSLPANLGFMLFNHRGKLFPPALKSKFPVC
ncbi:unnamed protein product [Calypogeia fissa]